MKKIKGSLLIAFILVIVLIISGFVVKAEDDSYIGSSYDKAYQLFLEGNYYTAMYEIDKYIQSLSFNAAINNIREAYAKAYYLRGWITYFYSPTTLYNMNLATDDFNNAIDNDSYNQNNLGLNKIVYPNDLDVSNDSNFISESLSNIKSKSSFKNAKKAYEDGNYEEALLNIDLAIKMNPSMYEYYEVRSDIFSALGKNTEAQADLFRMFWLSEDGIKGRELITANKNQDAFEYFNQLTEKYPDLAVVYYLAGSALFNMKDYENALINYQKAVEIDKGFALYHFGTGITLFSLKEYEESIKHLKIAYEIEPENAEYSGNLGLSYYALKDYSVAINYFLESLEVNNIHAIRWAYLGNSYYFAGANGLAYDAHKRALGYGTESISIDAASLSVFAVNNLILARESNDNDYSKSLLQEGLVMISMALDLYPDNSDYIYIRDLIIEEQEK